MPPSAHPTALRSRLLRLALQLCAAALLVAISFYVGVRIYTVYLTHRIAAMLHETAAIRLDSPEDSLHPFLTRYKAFQERPEQPTPIDTCADKEACALRNAHLPDHVDGIDFSLFDIFNFMQQPGPLNHPLAVLMTQTPPSRRSLFSLRNFLARTRINIRSGRVQSVSTALAVEGRTGWITSIWSLSDGTNRSGCEPKPYCATGTFLTIFGESRGGIQHRLTPSATPEQFQAAQSFNPNCLSALFPCTTLSDLNPRAFAYFQSHPQESPGISP